MNRAMEAHRTNTLPLVSCSAADERRDVGSFLPFALFYGCS